MNKIIKGLFKSESGKNGRVPLIFITVLIICSVIFSCMNFMPCLKKSFEKDIRDTKVGISEYIVYDKDYNFYNDIKNENFSSFNVLNLKANICNKDSNIPCSLMAVDKNTFEEVFSFIGGNLNNSNIIVSSKYAENHNLKENQTISIELFGEQIQSVISYIDSDNKYLNANENIVLISKEYIENLNSSLKGKSSVTYIYNCKTDDILNEFDDNFIVEEAVNNDDIESRLNTYFWIFLVIFAFVVIAGNNVLSSISEIFVVERTHFLGSLRSVGTTKKTIINIFKSFERIIGFWGSIVGIFLGTVFIIIYSKVSLGVKFVFDVKYFSIGIVVTVICGCLLTALSVSSPLQKALKKSDKDLLLESTSVFIKNKVTLLNFIAVIMIVILPFIPVVIEVKSSIYWLVSVAIISVCLFLVLRLIFWIINKLVNSRVRRGTFFIGLRNVANNFFVRKVISTTITTSLFIILIVTISISTANSISSFYYDYKADGFIYCDNGIDEDKLSQIRNNDLIISAFPYTSGNIDFDGKKTCRTIVTSDIKTLDNTYINLHLKWMEGFDYSEFSKDYNIVISKIYSDRYDLSFGDYVNIGYDNITHKYRIVGIADSMFEFGDMTYLSSYQLPFADFKDISGVYIKTFNKIDDEFEASIDDIFKDETCRIRSVESMISNDKENSKQIFTLFYTFAIFIVLSNLIGIYNNYKLSYIYRRKEMSIMYSCGYTLKRQIRIIVSEVLVSVVLGCGFSLLSLKILIPQINELMCAIEIPIPLKCNGWLISILFGVILIIGLLSILLGIKYIRLAQKNLINNLKNE